MNDYMASYYEKNKEKMKKYSKLYYHQGKGKEVWENFKIRNKEKYLGYHRDYYHNNIKKKKSKKKKTMTKEKKSVILFFD
jgi:hypothetical protein